MTLQVKSLTIEDVLESGKGVARLAILSAVDNDGDTYASGAFSWKEGGVQWAPMISAHNRGVIPFGKAKILERDDQALAEFQLNLETQSGKDWYAALKFDLETGQPVQEWSYGYEILDAEFRGVGQNRVRVIKQTDVQEISTVIRGAGIGAVTLGIKSAELKADHYAALLGSLGELASALPGDPAAISATGVKQLESIEAAIGKSLASLRGGGDPDLTVDTALAGYLLHQSREHVRPEA